MNGAKKGSDDDIRNKAKAAISTLRSFLDEVKTEPQHVIHIKYGNELANVRTDYLEALLDAAERRGPFSQRKAKRNQQANNLARVPTSCND